MPPATEGGTVGDGQHDPSTRRMTTVSYRYWLIEAPLSYPDDAQDMELPTLRLAESALLDRVSDLVADDFTIVRQGPEHATLKSPEGETVRLFIEEGRATPLVLTDATDFSPDQMADYLGISPDDLAEYRALNNGHIYE